MVKTTRRIHHNQLLFAKFAKNPCHIESMTSKWRQKCSPLQIIEPLNYGENLGTRLCYILCVEKQRAKWRNSFENEEIFWMNNCWFSHDVTKFQTSELLILLRFYFHDVLEQPKTNLHTNFHSEWVLGLVIDYAWISKLLRDVAFTCRASKLWCWFKKGLISGNLAIWTVLVLE